MDCRTYGTAAELPAQTQPLGILVRQNTHIVSKCASQRHQTKCAALMKDSMGGKL